MLFKIVFYEVWKHFKFSISGDETLVYYIFFNYFNLPYEWLLTKVCFEETNFPFSIKKIFNLIFLSI